MKCREVLRGVAAVQKQREEGMAGGWRAGQSCWIGGAQTVFRLAKSFNHAR